MKPQGKLSLTPATKTSLKTKIAVYGSGVAIVMAFAVVAINLIPGDLSGRLPGYAWRKAIMVDTARVAPNTVLEDFVLYVELTDPDLRNVKYGGYVEDPGGADIRFTDGEGAWVIPQQIEHYNAKKGELTARVQVSELRQDQPAVIFLYYGNPDPRFTMFGQEFSEASLEFPRKAQETTPDRWAVIQQNHAMPDSFLLISEADSVAAPMPVTFEHYQAKVKGGSLVMLEWMTNQEYESRKFIIERSYDNEQYEELGKTSGAGTSEERLRYSYADHNLPKGLTFYRLKHISRDNTFSYAAITQLAHSTQAGKLEIDSIEPNPFQKDFEVTFSSGSPAPVELTLYDQNGNTLHKETLQAQSGKNRWRYPQAEALPKGVYVLTLIGANKKLQTELITKE